MKLKKEFVTYQTGDKQVMVAVGGAGFSGLVRSNESAADIVDLLKNETTRDQIVIAMKEKYDAPDGVIERDVDRILATLRGIGALDE